MYYIDNIYFKKVLFNFNLYHAINLSTMYYTYNRGKCSKDELM